MGDRAAEVGADEHRSEHCRSADREEDHREDLDRSEEGEGRAVKAHFRRSLDDLGDVQELHQPVRSEKEDRDAGEDAPDPELGLRGRGSAANG